MQFFDDLFYIYCMWAESSESKIISNAKEIVEADLSDGISINKCLYNEGENAVYLKVYSFEHGNDEAIILFRSEERRVGKEC